MRGFHHVELWVAELERASAEWGWLLDRVGFEAADSWTDSRSWRAGDAYLTICTPPRRSADAHDRRRPGMNHLAFHGGSRSDVDRLMAEALEHGGSPLYQERYPHAGGAEHYAGWLENGDGFKAEIVAE